MESTAGTLHKTPLNAVHRESGAKMVVREDGSSASFPVTVRIDQAAEVAIFGHGGILPMVLREALGAGD